jgi:hypothetical protein
MVCSGAGVAVNWAKWLTSAGLTEALDEHDATA